MSPFLQLIFALMVIVVAAKTGSYISIRLGQPSVLGKLVVGLLLGPTLLDLAHLPFITDTHLTEIIVEIGELGVLLLMFIAGLELHLSELAKNAKVSAYAGILGVIAPVASGWGVGMAFGMDNRTALFLGLILGATSVSISAQTLIELKALRTRVGLGLLGAAVFDDILVILLLSTFLALQTGSGGFTNIALIFLRITLFLGLSVILGIKVLPWMTRKVSQLPVSQGSLSLALVVLMLYGLASEIVGGMAAITGAFLAGLMFARTHEKERIEHGIHALSYSLFVPVFFISIGMNVNLREVDPKALWLLLAISVTGILGKLVGAGIGARLGGFTLRESIQLGAGMVSRGEVGLIVASIGVQQGLIHADVLSAVIGMVIATTLITPPLLRALFASQPPARHASKTKSQIQPKEGKAHVHGHVDS